MSVAETPVVDPHSIAPPGRSLALRVFTSAICVVIPILIGILPFPIEANTQLALAITSFMILAWMTNIMDYAAAGLVGCTLYWATGVAEPEVALEGFPPTPPGSSWAPFYWGVLPRSRGSRSGSVPAS